MNQADIPANQVAPASSPAMSSRVISRRWRRWVDSSARVAITLGGWATIVSIFGIFAYLFIEVAPLFYAASWTESSSVHVDPEARQNPRNVAVGINEYMEVGYVLRNGDISFYTFPAGIPIHVESVPDFENGEITALARSPGERPYLRARNGNRPCHSFVRDVSSHVRG